MLHRPPGASAPGAAFTVDTTADSGPGSLRQAILEANASPGADTILFAIGAVGSQQTIQTASVLPAISDPVLLDGWSQGGSGYTGPPLIAINGSLAGSSVHGLTITASDSTVRGLVVNGFASGGYAGIRLQTGDGNWIYGNYVGTDFGGTTAVANGMGILVESGSDNNVIGTNGDGTNDLAERNLVSGNGPGSSAFGVNLATAGNLVAGNYIGIDANGTAVLGNGSIGVRVAGHNNVVGTNGDGQGDAAEGNVIAGNGPGTLAHGVTIVSHDGNRIAGNRIGIDVTGTLDLGNGGHGVSLSPCSSGGCDHNVIGTNGDGVSDALEGNIISGNAQDGIFTSFGSGSNVIAGNLIGLNRAGTAALPNDDDGVEMRGGGNRIGTNGDGISDVLERNVISANDDKGISLGSISGAADNNVVAGNYIGTDLAGLVAIGNQSTGLYVENGDNNRLGTNGDGLNDAAEGNVIAANDGHGIHLHNAYFNLVAGNLIGVAGDGVTPMSNIQNGVYISNNSDDNTVGGTAPGLGNVIAHNGADGVFVDDYGCGAAFCIRNRIVGNAIFGNLELGIDLFPNGINANDPQDNDTGANMRQNYPVLTAAASFGGSLVITGTLNTTPDQSFALDFYLGNSCSAGTVGEGAVYLGGGQVTTDASGDAAFVVTLAAALQHGDAVTATTTDNLGNTSEFSSCVLATGEMAIAGVQAYSNSPTILNQPTHFTATVAAGTNVNYTWGFGDGGSGSGASASHVYTATGSYTAVVTASNSLSSATAVTLVHVVSTPECAATPDDGVTVFSSADATALQQAVDAAAPTATVKVAGYCAGVSSRSGYTQTLYLASPLTLGGGYTLTNWITPNPALNPTVLDAQSLGRVIYVTGTAQIKLADLLLTNGFAPGSGAGVCPDFGCGGGLYTNGNVQLDHVTFQANEARRTGGAHVGGQLVATETTWLNNAANIGSTLEQHGGALAVFGPAQLFGGTMQGNVSGYGGGIFAAASLVVDSTHFNGNIAAAPSTFQGGGGAIFTLGPTRIVNAYFESNVSESRGGALRHGLWGEPAAPELFIANSTFLANQTNGSGGALETLGPTIINGSIFQGNHSVQAGGAIYAENLWTPHTPLLTLTDSTLTGNSVNGQGGGVYLSGDYTNPSLIRGCLFQNNSSLLHAGGASLAGPGPTEILETTFSGNSAASLGGAILVSNGSLTMESSMLRDNQAGAYGSALRLSSALPTRIVNTVITAGAGAVTGTISMVNIWGPVEMSHVTLVGNSSSTLGILLVTGGPLARLSLTNSIVVSQSIGIAAPTGSVTATRTLLHGNVTDVTGRVTNLDPLYGDPRFVDPATGDYHLSLGSTAIDAALSSTVLTDVDGDVRPIISLSDLGADEYGDSAYADPFTDTGIGLHPIFINLPAGSVGGPTHVLLQPQVPPAGFQEPMWRAVGPGFELGAVPLTQIREGGPPTFLRPVTVTLHYTDADVANVDEASLFLAVLDGTSGGWVDATTTCTPAGAVVRLPDDNQIDVAICDTGKFTLIGSGRSGTHQIFLPLIVR